MTLPTHVSVAPVTTWLYVVVIVVILLILRSDILTLYTIFIINTDMFFSE